MFQFCSNSLRNLEHILAEDKTAFYLKAIVTGAFSSRRIQQIIKAAAENAGITKNVYPHLLRHTVATFLLERGMPLEQIQKFLGHSKIETTQIYAESSAEMLKDSYRKALST